MTKEIAYKSIIRPIDTDLPTRFTIEKNKGEREPLTTKNLMAKFQGSIENLYILGKGYRIEVTLTNKRERKTNND